MKKMFLRLSSFLFVIGSVMGMDDNDDNSRHMRRSSSAPLLGAAHKIETQPRSHSLPAPAVRISERDQFLKITPEEAKDIKSIEFVGHGNKPGERFVIDNEIAEHWFTVFPSPAVDRGSDSDLLPGHVFDSISLDKCTFSQDGVYIFYNIVVKNVAIKNSDITAAQVDTILRGIEPYSIHTIDLSHNRNLQKEEDRLYKSVCTHIGGGRMALETLDLRGNDFARDMYKDVSVGEILF
jgi:hypothetical protein